MYKSLVVILLSLFVSCAHAEKKEIRASEIQKLIKKGQPVQLVDKIILDDLDFTQAKEPVVLNAGILQAEITSNVSFFNCIFMGKVTANGEKKSVPVQSCFKSNLIFWGCDFRGEANFENTVVFGSVNFSKSAFHEKASFNNFAAWSKDTQFLEVEADKAFSMIYGSFYGNLNFMDAKFHDRFSMQETTVNGKMNFNNCVFDQKADFSLAKISGRSLFNYAVFSKTANFSFASFFDSFELGNAKFDSGIDINGSYFYKDLKSDTPVDKSQAKFLFD